MSGGHFNYAYTTPSFFADELRLEIDVAGKDGKPNIPFHIERQMKEIADVAEFASKLMREAEWYYSGDTGDESFMLRVEEILKEIPFIWLKRDNK